MEFPRKESGLALEVKVCASEGWRGIQRVAFFSSGVGEGKLKEGRTREGDYHFWSSK